MGLNIYWGYWLFFLVPLVLWFIGATFVRRKELSAKYFAFIAGGDNRLSLSRLQAFAWTLIIFGSFFAAMAVHKSIPLVTQAEADEKKSLAEQAKNNLAGLQAAAETARKDRDIANNNFVAKKTLLESIQRDSPQDAKIAVATDGLTSAKTDLDAKEVVVTTAEQKLQEAKNTINEAATPIWVDIPTTLLALAGIAIGSGIFSNLISALNSEDKTACVTEIKHISADDFNIQHETAADALGNPIQGKRDAPETDSQNLLQIVGTNLDKTGKVRFGKGKVYSVYASVIYWRDDGSEIVVEVPSRHPYDTLVVDTPNGKLCYELIDQTNSATGLVMKLGVGKYYYEFSDLFRDDKNPNSMDLMKFQMFGWTVVAILVYTWLFLKNLDSNISSLPIVPTSIVILTGLSQAGYLAGKGVSNVDSNNNQRT